MKYHTIKLSLVFLALACGSGYASGFRYYIIDQTPTHLGPLSTDSFSAANQRLRSWSFQNKLPHGVEIFVIPADIGFKVLVGLTEKDLTFSEEDLIDLAALARDALFDREPPKVNPPREPRPVDRNKSSPAKRN